MPLKWEFPGGKVEPGEEQAAALHRELQEELGISARIEEKVTSVQHHYRRGGAVELHFYRVQEYEGEIENRFVICYTGEPRLSGINNWEVFKRHIDGDRSLFQIFEVIRDAAAQMREALLAADWNAVGEIMRFAYPNRQRLAPNITTPHMNALVGKALANGAEAAKVCGAIFRQEQREWARARDKIAR